LQNLREVFDNPPAIYDATDEAMSRAALHVIIMDEFDAMARSRGGRSGKGDQGDAGVARDSVVNQVGHSQWSSRYIFGGIRCQHHLFIHSFIHSNSQLLSKMDGVDALVVPTLVIGLTNKRSLIDAGK
jgi:SpoVK/Ycf46/Vps4 family AAA+-type ATPase